MKAKLKRIHSPDVNNLLAYHPIEPDNFGLLLQLMVGPAEGEGEESFDVMVCTPKWLKENHSLSDVVFGRHYLIVFQYEYDRIYRALAQYVDGIEGDDWIEVASKVGRIGKWEFEDYQ